MAHNPRTESAENRSSKRGALVKLAVLGGALLAATVLTVVRPMPEVSAAPGLLSSKANPAYNLAALKVVNLTLQKIHDNYVDPARIDARGMLLAALDGVQKNIAEVLIEPAADKKQVTVLVNDKQKIFPIGDVDSPWRLHKRMQEIFRFIGANMNPTSDPAQIEYAAANGLLSTLDPHSILLDPEQAREMESSTSGKFGGIGIEIGMRKGRLTVLRLIDPATPAARAGLKAGDHIVKINNEPTAHLTLTEAMSRLRGDPQTRVMVTIERRGLTGMKDIPITRDQIRVPSVESRMLKGNVGYLKVKTFQQSTETDLRNAMKKLKAQGARGWVLDLRWNPGGLLDQSIKIADLFVESGTLVTTVGMAGKVREEKRARVAGTDAQSPVAVLVNGGSASASEIVAGALKNLNRAVVIGQTTFGKGSVQVLFDNDDGTKLKLTIAQYLTPGDVSIQSVGITPDIELQRLIVPETVKTRCDVVRLLGKSRLTREADLDAHLTSKNAKNGDKPVETMKYLFIRPEGEKPPVCDEEEDADAVSSIEDEELEPPSDKFVEDFEMQFARDLVVQAGASRRTEMLNRARALVQKKRAEEDAKITAALGKIGIDWTGRDKAGAPKLTATFTTDRPGNKVAAGQVVAITGTVTNKGTAPAARVHTYMKTDDWVFDDTELVFGKIAPGQSKSFTAYVRVPHSAASHVDEIDFIFSEQHGARVDVQPLKLTVEGLPRPLFAYSYQFIEDKGNGDGLLQLGESARLHVTVKNLGAGKSFKTDATLRNTSGDGVVVNKGRFSLDSIAPGESKDLDFVFDVKKDFRAKELVVELIVYDTKLHESVTEKLKFPVRPPSAGPQAARGFVRVTKKDGVVVREGASDSAAIIGSARKGATFKVTGRDGAWTRVELAPRRPGFVPSSAVANGGSAATAGAFTPVLQVTPPQVAVKVPSLETTGDRWKLSGTVVDDKHVEDVYVLVSNRDAKIEGKKVFYRSNRGSKTENKMDFSGQIPIWPGNNVITVVARENNEVRTMQTVFVYRSDGVKRGARAAR